MISASEFYQGLKHSMLNLIDSVRPWRGTVNTVTSGLITVTPDSSGVALSEQLARIAGFKVSATDELMILPFGGSHIVLGELERSVPGSRTLDAPLVVEGVVTSQGLTSSGAITATTIGGTAITGTTISGTAITGTSFNSPIIKTLAQSSADTSSTTSTSTYATAGTASVVLGSGSWTVYVIGGCQLTHSSGGNINMQILIDGDASTAITLSANASSAQGFMREHSLGSRTGTINVDVKYKSSAAGTTSARNPWAFIIAKRTS